MNKIWLLSVKAIVPSFLLSITPNKTTKKMDYGNFFRYKKREVLVLAAW
jgi:hypothetical protein